MERKAPRTQSQPWVPPSGGISDGNFDFSQSGVVSGVPVRMLSSKIVSRGSFTGIPVAGGVWTVMLEQLKRFNGVAR
jgi:hypothetical protein